jgi:hypothetical protein
MVTYMMLSISLGRIGNVGLSSIRYTRAILAILQGTTISGLRRACHVGKRSDFENLWGGSESRDDSLRHFGRCVPSLDAFQIMRRSHPLGDMTDIPVPFPAMEVRVRHSIRIRRGGVACTAKHDFLMHV